MDIAIIVPELNKFGGAEKYIIECAKRWQDEHKITLYASKLNLPLLQRCGLHRFEHRVLSPYFCGEHSLLLNSVLLPKIWEREIGRHDLYQTHLWPMHLLDLHPMLWCAQEPLRVVKDLKFEHPLLEMAEQGMRRIYTYPKISHDMVSSRLIAANQRVIEQFDQTGQPDRIVANSQHSARYLSEIYQRPVTDVVYPGINPADFFYQPPAENMVLCVNQLWQHKRVNLVIEAMQFVEQAHLYIVGEGPERESLQSQTEALGLADRVFFLGNVSDEELAILYARTCCVAFAPIREPFGIVALEAMTAGKPLVAADEGGYAEIVEPGAGFLVRPTPMAFAEKINFLLENKEIAAEMGRRGRAVAARFTWDETASQLMRLMKEMLDEQPVRNAATGAATALAQEPVRVGVDYFAWYGKGAGSAHWNDNLTHGVVRQKPLLGYYSSDCGEVIRAHLQLLQQAGVDFVAVNIHVTENGVQEYELAVAERMAQIIEEDGREIRICAQICPYVASLDVLVGAIRGIRQRLCDRTAYFNWQGQPVAFVFWTGAFDGDLAATKAIRRELPEFCLIASSLRLYDQQDESRKTFGLFDGWSLFSPLEATVAADRWQALGRVYQQFAAGAKAIRVFTCSPGYDDRDLQDPSRRGNRQRLIDRQSGETLRTMLNMAAELLPRPQLIKISTFNEFHENTHIEPTVAEGSQYIELLRQGLRRLPGRNEQ